jgi:hypothetical protein
MIVGAKHAQPSPILRTLSVSLKDDTVKHNDRLQNILQFKISRRHKSFFSTIPDESRFHEDNQNKLTFSIQYERLTPSFDHLKFLDKEGKNILE